MQQSHANTSRWLLPALIVIGATMIVMCLSDAHDVVTSGRLFGRTALAETGTPASEGHESPHAPSGSITDAPNDTPSQQTQTPSGAHAEDPPALSGAPPDNVETSPAELDVLKQLSARREALDHRAQDIDKREALLKIYEQRIEQKTRELTALRQQIQTLLGQANETQAAQLDNLVKIYETMKPEDAAKIFDSLDMQILLGVIQRMKPKSTAPIMAKMSSEKAKEVTISLLKQDKLPQIK